MTPTATAPTSTSTAVAAPQPRALSPRDQAFISLRTLLEKKQKEILAALPKHIAPGYFLRVVLTAVQRTPQLLEADPLSFLGAVLQCAQLGLVPDGFLGQAYLIPYRNNKRTPPRLEVQFQPGYRGLISLARRSGEVSTIHAEVVYAKDHFRYVRGFTPILEHTPSEDADPGKLTHTYAWYRLKDGAFDCHVMTEREVHKIRARSQAFKGGKKDSPWFTDPEWMWKKTCLKQLLKLAPLSTELVHAAGLDDAHEIGLAQDLALLADDTQELTPLDETALLEGEGAEDIVQMPQRTSEQPTTSTAPVNGNSTAVVPPEPKAEPTPNGPPTGEHRLVEVRAIERGDKSGFWWVASIPTGILFTTDVSIGPKLEPARAAGKVVRLTTHAKQEPQGWRIATLDVVD